MKYVLSLILSCVFTVSFGQNLKAKYDTYKKNFKKNFVRIDWEGDGIGSFDKSKGHYSKAGFSLPVSLFIQEKNGNKYWEFNHRNCKDNDRLTEHPNVLKWADGTLHLGYYWATLATEYLILKKSGEQQKAQRTLHELYLALQAYRRLDMTGQQIAIDFNNNIAKNCNEKPLLNGYTGFFIRDDVPREWANKLEVGGIISSLACRENTRQFFTDKGKGNVVSQDQVAMLLFGLAFIKRCIPDQAFSFNNRKVNLIEMSEKIANGIVGHIHKSFFRNIKFPMCRGGKVQTGGNSIVYAFAMRRALDFIYPGHKIKSPLRDRWAWEALAEDIGVNAAGVFNAATNDNIGMYLTYCASADMESFNDAQRKSKKESNKEIFILAKTFLHQYPTEKVSPEIIDRMRNLLYSAPSQGSGRTRGTTKSDLWRFDNRWRTHKDGRLAAGQGNGLDFMLAYNLWVLLGFDIH